LKIFRRRKMQINLNTKKQSTRGGGFIAAFMFILFGIIILKITGFIFADMEETLQWPSVPGIITVSEVVSSQGTNSDGKEVTNYMANVSAEYEVNGSRHHSDSITPVQMTSSTVRSVIQKDIKPYPVGAKVEVFYNPDQPSYGILKPGVPPLMKWLRRLPWLAIVAGIIIIVKRIILLAGLGAAVGVAASQESTKPSKSQPPEDKKSPPEIQEDAFNL